MPRVLRSLSTGWRSSARRQRRLLVAIAVAAVLAVAAVAAELATRSAAAPASPSSAPGCARKVGTAAASTGTGYVFARRDEVRMLCLVISPPGAQLLTSEPAVMTRLGQRFFGLPKPFAPFARHRIWEVHSSVTAVVSFEKAHPPAGLSGGCGAKAGGDGGVGVVCGPNVPANAGLQFTLPPIRGRVESRVLRMTILALPGGWTAIRVDAVNRPWMRGA